MNDADDKHLELSKKIFDAIVPRGENGEDRAVLIDVTAVIESLSIVCSFFISRCPPETQIDMLALWQRNMLLLAHRLMKGEDLTSENEQKH
jgi:hypothetical protein